MQTLNSLLVGSLVALGATGLVACQSNGYASSLALDGAESQRDLGHSVTSVLEAQMESQSEFDEAFQLLLQLQRAPQEDVVDLYAEFQKQVDSCARNVERVDQGILTVEQNATELFASWEAELDQFSSPTMRERSEARMGQAQHSLQRLLDQLRNARGSMDAILRTQRDFVLYFNHNLSPNSIATLEPENAAFESSMAELGELIQRAREAADALMGELQGSSPIAPAGA